MNIAIITARGGSKRIPGKNSKPFLGKPIIAYAIEAAHVSGLFPHIVVSTDDEHIARLARQFGAEVPFLRPRELSDDHAGTDAVLVHAVAECRRIYGPWEYGCCIYPANPFLQTHDLERGLKLLTEKRATCAFPVVKYDFPIEQAISLLDSRPIAKWPEQMAKNSQDLPDHYHDAGSFYWFNVDRFMASGQLFDKDAVAFTISAERCQDINTPEDWKRAEVKFRVLAEQDKT